MPLAIDDCLSAARVSSPLNGIGVFCNTQPCPEGIDLNRINGYQQSPTNNLLLTISYSQSPTNNQVDPPEKLHPSSISMHAAAASSIRSVSGQPNFSGQPHP